MTTRTKPDYLKYVGTVITIITIGAGIISGYSSLNARVDSLEKNKADTVTVEEIKGDIKGIRVGIESINKILEGRYDRR